MLIEFLKQYGDQRVGDVYDHQHGGVADMLIRRGIARLVPVPVVEVPVATAPVSEVVSPEIEPVETLDQEVPVPVVEVPVATAKANKRK